MSHDDPTQDMTPAQAAAYGDIPEDLVPVTPPDSDTEAPPPMEEAEHDLGDLIVEEFYAELMSRELDEDDPDYNDPDVPDYPIHSMPENTILFTTACEPPSGYGNVPDCAPDAVQPPLDDEFPFELTSLTIDGDDLSL